MVDKPTISSPKTNNMKEGERQPMVKWYSPTVFAKTGFRAIVSDIFSIFSDKRENFSRTTGKEPFNEVPAKYNSEDFWFDFVADLGDGFNSTYSVAYALSQEKLKFKIKNEKEEEKEIELPMGKVLLMGGDEVYPFPSREDYLNRTWLPYEDALPDENPDMPGKYAVYAVPGNHDWYDGISNFIKRFCQKSKMGERQAKQDRSYFAIRLPHNWWVWGIDIQLDAFIDELQMDYFKTIALNDMQPGAKIILMAAEPWWTIKKNEDKSGDTHRFKTLDYFISHVIQGNGIKKSKDPNSPDFGINDPRISEKKLDLKVVLTGDLHHYSRYESNLPCNGGQNVQWITCGGGGAFLHPTHHLPKDNLLESIYREKNEEYRFRRITRYPERDDSKSYVYGNFLFAWKNLKLSMIFGGVFAFAFAFLQAYSLELNEKYEVTTSFVQHVITDPDSITEFSKTLAKETFTGTSHEWLIKEFSVEIINNPFLVSIVLMIFGFAFMTMYLEKSIRGPAKVFIAIFYTLVHTAVGFLLIYLICCFVKNLLATSETGTKIYYTFCFIALVMAFTFAIMTIVSGTIIGIYFIIMDFFGRLSNESYSALCIEDRKCFLRMKIDGTGALTIYPIRMDKVCKGNDWEENPEAAVKEPMKKKGSVWQPKSKDWISKLEIIETIPPIR